MEHLTRQQNGTAHVIGIQTNLLMLTLLFARSVLDHLSGDLLGRHLSIMHSERPRFGTIPLEKIPSVPQCEKYGSIHGKVTSERAERRILTKFMALDYINIWQGSD